MSVSIERMPPYNLEAEQSVLGSMLIDKMAILKAMEMLQPDDFYNEDNRTVYKAIVELFDREHAADLITVSEWLRQSGVLEDVGGLAYLTTLANIVPTAANIEYYARIVKEKAILRHLIEAATGIIHQSYAARDDVDLIVDAAEQAIFDISQKRSSQRFYTIKEVLMETLERIEYLYGNKGGVTGIPTGFKDLDDLTSGFQPSDLIILAARPSQGKTTMALNIARNAALKERVQVGIFSLEMDKEQIAQRLLCAEASINGQKLRQGFLSEDDWKRLSIALGRLGESQIYIDDTPNISIMELRTKARRIKAEYGLSLLIVDYLQLMQGRGRPENRQQEISEISRSLKALARELRLPVLALSQLSRAVEQRQDRKPLLSDLRESGAIEQDADVVMFLYSNPDVDNPNMTEIIVAKQRNGPTGSVKVYFQRDTGRFESLDARHTA